jgi:hypothetical protein
MGGMVDSAKSNFFSTIALISLSTIAIAKLSLASASSGKKDTLWSVDDSVFGEDYLAIVRVKTGKKSGQLELGIVGCFPSTAGEGVNAQCEPKHSLGDRIRPVVFVGGRIFRDIEFEYRQRGQYRQFLASVKPERIAGKNAAAPTQGFVADSDTLKRFEEKVRAARAAGKYRALIPPFSYAEGGLKVRAPLPRNIEEYDLDNDGIANFLFLPPSAGTSEDGEILIHEPGKKEWVRYDSGCC